MTEPSSPPRSSSSSSDPAPPPTPAPPPPRRRAPITAVAVFGLGALVALAAGIVLWLGIGSTAETTRVLMQERFDAVLDDLERQLRSRFEPVHQQARWIVSLAADGALDLAEQDRLDAFMFGALAATPQVATLGFFRPDGRGRAWYRGARVAVREDQVGLVWVVPSEAESPSLPQAAAKMASTANAATSRASFFEFCFIVALTLPDEYRLFAAALTAI